MRLVSGTWPKGERGAAQQSNIHTCRQDIPDTHCLTWRCWWNLTDGKYLVNICRQEIKSRSITKLDFDSVAERRRMASFVLHDANM